MPSSPPLRSARSPPRVWALKAARAVIRWEGSWCDIAARTASQGPNGVTGLSEPNATDRPARDRAGERVHSRRPARGPDDARTCRRVRPTGRRRRAGRWPAHRAGQRRDLLGGDHLDVLQPMTGPDEGGCPDLLLRTQERIHHRGHGRVADDVEAALHPGPRGGNQVLGHHGGLQVEVPAGPGVEVRRRQGGGARAERAVRTEVSGDTRAPALQGARDVAEGPPVADGLGKDVLGLEPPDRVEVGERRDVRRAHLVHLRDAVRRGTAQSREDHRPAIRNDIEQRAPDEVMGVPLYPAVVPAGRRGRARDTIEQGARHQRRVPVHAGQVRRSPARWSGRPRRGWGSCPRASRSRPTRTRARRTARSVVRAQRSSGGRPPTTPRWRGRLRRGRARSGRDGHGRRRMRGSPGVPRGR